MKAVVLIILLSTAFACIGNPNGVALSLESVDLEAAKALCEQNCVETEGQMIYTGYSGLAVTLTDTNVDIQIPLTLEEEPAFEFEDWDFAYTVELTKLKNAGAVNLTDEEIQTISTTVSASGIYAFVSGMSSANMAFRAETVDEVTTAGEGGEVTTTHSWCGTGPVYESDLQPSTAAPETAAPIPGAEPIEFPDLGDILPGGLSSSAPSMSIEEGAAEKPVAMPVEESEPVTQPTALPSLLNFWWVGLFALAIILLTFKFTATPVNTEDMAALAYPRRVDMMKSLSQRRKTLTEISKENAIALPSAKEHLDKLAKTGLVKKIDTGHKWKYYELTKKGKNILDSTDN